MTPMLVQTVQSNESSKIREEVSSNDPNHMTSAAEVAMPVW